jgi:hypothetical protein
MPHRLHFLYHIFDIGTGLKKATFCFGMGLMPMASRDPLVKSIKASAGVCSSEDEVILVLEPLIHIEAF